MKAQDLMIGDWVYIHHGGKATHYGKVTALLPSGAIESEIDGSYALSSSVEPIHITPELLEKNGFERDFEDGSLIWVDEQDVTEVVWGGTILTIHGENGHLELDTCMYVHELQHALRLCGIDKEIVI